MYRPEPLQNSTKSYPNNGTMMLRNTAAGKAAIKPLNTSNSKIVTVGYTRGISRSYDS